MIGDLLNKIRAHYKAFTKTERKVADFILSNPKEVLYLSISELAEKCGVGDTTVFRFCRTLDLGGYQDFKMSLAQSVSNEREAAYPYESITLEDSVEQECAKLLGMEIQALQSTYKMLNYRDVLTAVQMIGKASRIGFFGCGASSLTALAAKNRFAAVIPNVFHEMDSHMQATAASLMEKGDLAVIVSYSGTTKDMIDTAHLLKENGADVICITGYAKSPITKYADISLLCGAKEGPMQGGAMATKISQLYLIDILYTEYYRRNYDECVKNRKMTVKAISDKLL